MLVIESERARSDAKPSLCLALLVAFQLMESTNSDIPNHSGDATVPSSTSVQPWHQSFVLVRL